MAARFVAELDIQNDNTRRDFATLLESRPDCRVLTPDDSDSPDLVIMDMQRSYQDVLQRAERIRQHAPSATFFVAGFRIDADDLVKLMRADIADFISLPPKAEEVTQAIERFVEHREHTEQWRPKKAGKLINLMGSKGGIGTTTVAVNLAISLKERDREKSVALVDLDLQFGDVALFLDLKPKHSIIHAARDLERVANSEFMQGILTEHEASKISILPSASATEDFLLQPDAVCKTIEVLLTMFDYVVVDSGHVIHEITSEVLRRFPSLYLVSTLHLPVVRNTERFLAYMSSQEDVRLIINRHKSKYEEISVDDFSKAYKEVFFTIPNDYYTASSFLNQAKPIPYLSRWGKLSKRYRQLAAKVA